MKKILVTGATGFLGKRICEDLKTQDVKVVAQGRNSTVGSELEKMGHDFKKIDLTDDLTNLTIDIDCIIHSAALSSPWAKKRDFVEVNIEGTRKLIESAIQNKVKRFIYISSTSVYFNFKDRYNITETDSVAKRAPSIYTYTKLEAEKIVKSYKDKIEIIIIRPRGIFGPGDTTLIPRLLKAHDQGRLPVVGSKDTLVDITYVGNVSHAAILSIDVSRQHTGQIYNITNDEPVKIWELIDFILSSLGRKRIKKKVPFFLVYIIAFISEIICSLPFINKEPALTRYTAGLIAKSQTLSVDKAKQRLGYKPIKNIKEALHETIEWYKKEYRV
ncbi:MAG: NAD-dependent epimerase/dehydratase family protein [Bacteriovoracaceae bacterium]|jgi:nucleoside-diphosphate-sugar epimerase|nr:NAD-dependent epimerase/dehydratase family protein [Bacteriovoracaceae bacterium]